jgi:hypothetical protein
MRVAEAGTSTELISGWESSSESVSMSPRENRSLSPQASHIHRIGSERRFSFVMIGASLRLF